MLSTADALLLAEVYPGRRGADRRRRRPRAGARAARRRARSSRCSSRRSPTCRRRFARIARDGDVVVTMGAGSIGQVPPAAWRPAHDDDRATSIHRHCAASLSRDEPLARHTTLALRRQGGSRLRAGRPRRPRAFLRQLPPRRAADGARPRQQLLVRDGGVRGAVVLMHAPGRRARGRRRPGLRRGGRREPEARALRRDARLRRRRIPGRHSRHRRRRAGDERRLLRRRDLAARGEGRAR